MLPGVRYLSDSSYAHMYRLHGFSPGSTRNNRLEVLFDEPPNVLVAAAAAGPGAGCLGNLGHR